MLPQLQSTTPRMLGPYTKPPTNLISQVCFWNRNQPPLCMLGQFTKPPTNFVIRICFCNHNRLSLILYLKRFHNKVSNLDPTSNCIFKIIFIINSEYLDRLLLDQLSKTHAINLISVTLVSLHIFHKKKTFKVKRLLFQLCCTSSF